MPADSLLVLEHLRQAPVLRRLPLGELDRLVRRSRVRELAPGERLIEEGAGGRSVFLILEGRLAVRQRIGQVEESLLALRGVGEWVGEMAFVDHGPRAASVAAEGAARVLEVPRDAFLELVSGRGDAALDLLRLVTSRLRESDGRHIELLRRKNDFLVAANDQLHQENRELRAEVDDRRGLERFLGGSTAARDVRDAVRRAAQSALPVLILGETGTGKELLARALHAGSAAASRAFVAVNCGLFSDTLLESELFGHARGAFTGASAAKRGLVEAADGGTLFLDEVADMPRPLQSALLRFLELGEYRRLGETQVRQARPRVLAATHVDLERAVDEGSFRRDLLYRLDVVRIRIPPLRERRDDIPVLVGHLVASIAERLGVEPLTISASALDLLCTGEYPGNVRELENEIERLYVSLEPGSRVERDHLSPELRGPGARPGERYAEAVRSFKAALVASALADAEGNRAQAARRLGLHRSNLARMIRELGVDSPPARAPREGPR